MSVVCTGHVTLEVGVVSIGNGDLQSTDIARANDDGGTPTDIT